MNTITPKILQSRTIFPIGTFRTAYLNALTPTSRYISNSRGLDVETASEQRQTNGHHTINAFALHFPWLLNAICPE